MGTCTRVSVLLMVALSSAFACGGASSDRASGAGAAGVSSGASNSGGTGGSGDSGHGGSGGSSQGGSGNVTCGGAVCGADQRCCGPTECGVCIPAASGSYCPNTCAAGGSAGAGGTVGGGGAGGGGAGSSMGGALGGAAGSCGLQSGACSAGTSCQCCPGAGPTKHCLCTTACHSDADCKDPAQPSCDLNTANASSAGICRDSSFMCCWNCK